VTGRSRQLGIASPCFPFDRMLVAQALNELMRLVKSDARLAAYGDMIIAV